MSATPTTFRRSRQRAYRHGWRLIHLGTAGGYYGRPRCKGCIHIDLDGVVIAIPF